MNLRAIVIIIASSWAGTLITLSGLSIFSIPSVSSIGEVARVSIDVPTIRKDSLRSINIPWFNPSLVIVKKPMDHSSSPGVKNAFMENVRRRSIQRGLSPFNTYFRGIFESFIIPTRNIAIST